MHKNEVHSRIKPRILEGHVKILCLDVNYAQARNQPYTV